MNAGRGVPRAPFLPLGRSWRETPAVSSVNVLRWTNGSLYLFGGVVLLIGCFLLDWEAANRTGIASVAGGAVFIGVLIFALGARLPRWAFHATAVAGTGAITALVVLGNGGPASVSLTAPYMFVMVNSAILFALREALAQMVVAEVACAIAMAHVGASPGDIIIVEGCTIGLTIVVGWLARAANAAEEDPLTGLLNRRGLERRLDEVQRRADREGGHLSVALIDIDFFKQVNEAEGHFGGDRLLQSCAAAWQQLLPAGSFLARYGGDGFGLVMPGLPLGRAADVVDQLRSAVRRDVTVSAGVAGWQHGDTGSVLMGKADVAMYQAKTAGRDQTVVYGDPGRAASELETAIAEGQMRIYLQPVVLLATGEPVGFEALSRWHHPRRGLLGPDAFIPQAERTGAAHSLGQWVLHEACRLIHTLPGPRRSISVNVTVPELRSTEYAASVRRLLERYDLPGYMIILEVTEGAFDDSDPQIEATLRELRSLGILVAIDDFGSGQSSLRRIEHLPIDIIKVDGALVDAIREDSDEAPILQAVHTMGRALGVRLVAEHVETPHQAEVLRKIGYELAQGYLYGAPQPAPSTAGQPADR